VNRWISSIPRRLFRKQIVRASLMIRSASSSAASLSTERRRIVLGSITGGFQIAIRRRARGAPSESTSSNSVPVRPPASSTGLAIVAEASTNRGSEA
jgi:hypothetical protein